MAGRSRTVAGRSLSAQLGANTTAASPVKLRSRRQDLRPSFSAFAGCAARVEHRHLGFCLFSDATHRPLSKSWGEQAWAHKVGRTSQVVDTTSGNTPSTSKILKLVLVGSARQGQRCTLLCSSLVVASVMCSYVGAAETDELTVLASCRKPNLFAAPGRHFSVRDLIP
jgi:hypothetical protein